MIKNIGTIIVYSKLVQSDLGAELSLNSLSWLLSLIGTSSRMLCICKVGTTWNDLTQPWGLDLYIVRECVSVRESRTNESITPFLSRLKQTTPG
jgi:hypothetical protein